MKADFINPFLEASIGLFQEYLQVKLEHGKPFINGNPDYLQEVSAVIGLAGEAVGAVVLSFNRETAVKMVSKFSGVEYHALGSSVIDGVGELVNILAGNAKKDLSERRVEISLPGVITGHKYKINWPKDVPIITIPFDSEMGEFTVNVSFRET